ncbi:hypothetical protein GCM10020000_81780 [Streptomyces olivoverticillatus]
MTTSTRGRVPAAGGQGERLGAFGPPPDEDAAVLDVGYRAAGRVGERVGGQGSYLDRAPGGMRLPVEDHQHAEAARRFRARRQQRVAEVARAVAVRRFERALGAGEDHRTGIVVVEIEQEGRLLQRVRAVGDDDAVHTGVGEHLVHGAQQGELVAGGEPGAVHAHQVDDPYGHAVGHRGRGQHVPAPRVGGEPGPLPAAGDRPARADDDDLTHVRSPLSRLLLPPTVGAARQGATIGRIERNWIASSGAQTQKLWRIIASWTPLTEISCVSFRTTAA